MCKTITKTCRFCEEKFQAPLKEHKRGNANFCSLSCGASWNNSQRKVYAFICKECQTEFKSFSNHAKYCSKKCQQRYRNRNSSGKYKYRYHINNTINKLTSTSLCSNCGWDQSTCDIHHIIERKNGGTDDLNNLVIVCPNCHRLIHQGKLNPVTIKNVKEILGTT
jgi:hypothetical protein